MCKESGTAFAIPTYMFMVCIIGMTVWGFIRSLGGDLPLAESAQYDIEAEAACDDGLTGAAMAFLLRGRSRPAVRR